MSDDDEVEPAYKESFGVRIYEQNLWPVDRMKLWLDRAHQNRVERNRESAEPVWPLDEQTVKQFTFEYVLRSYYAAGVA